MTDRNDRFRREMLEAGRREMLEAAQAPPKESYVANIIVRMTKSRTEFQAGPGGTINPVQRTPVGVNMEGAGTGETPLLALATALAEIEQALRTNMAVSVEGLYKQLFAEREQNEREAAAADEAPPEVAPRETP